MVREHPVSATVERDARQHSMKELLARLARETLLLIQQEFTLAKVELMQRGAAIGAGATTLIIAASFALLGFAAFTAAVILAISLALAGWAAALIVAVGWGCIALIFVATGIASVRRAWPIAPQTIDTLKEDVEWAKARVKSDPASAS